MKPIITFLIFPLMIVWGSDTIVVGKKITAYSDDSNNPRITIDIKALKDPRNQQNKQPIVIEIDDNKSLTFIPIRFNPGKKDGDFTWVGKSKDAKSKAIFSIRNGVLVGTITCLDGKYKLYPENGHFKVIKVDPDMVIPFDIDTVSEPKRKIMPLPEQIQEEELLEENAYIIQSQESSETIQASDPSSSDSIVNVLVYYTQSLKDEYGINTEAMIQSNLDVAKDSYIDSETEINLQIAMIKKIPSGSLLDSANPNSLSDLLNKMEEDGLVRYERQVYNADAVTVFSNYPENGTSCGLATTPNSITSNLINAFSANHIKPASEGGYYCSDLTFAHELGHNFGCYHDSDHVTSGVPMYPYAYGYDIPNTFGTIMSYDGPEISFFSNPNIAYNAYSIGDSSSANNARAIRENQIKMSDNSEQISEVLESEDNDVLNEYEISGRLNSFEDRDGYIMWLEGNTRFIVENTVYSNNPFFLNIYNEDTHAFITSFNDGDKTIILPKGRYRVTFSFSNDETGTYYDLTTINYTTVITTEYVSPVFSHVMPSIINYLLN